MTTQWLKEFDPQLQKAATAARVRQAFIEAVMDVFPSDKAASFVLDHVQAVYVMRDDEHSVNVKEAPRPQILLRVYSDDSVVRAEIDARQEFIRLALAKRNITYDVCKIYASKFGMKKRPPLSSFASSDEFKHEDVGRHGLNNQQMDALASKIGDAELSRAFRKALEATRG